MLRRCLSSLLLFAALIAGYFYWFDRVFDPPGSYIGAAVMGFTTLCCIGALINAWMAAKDRSLLRTAEYQLPPSDGKLIAASGEIRPLGQPVIAPFSGEECVLCEYDISALSTKTTKGDDGPQRQTLYSGYLMNPCAVHARHEKVRLLGFPQLEEVKSFTLHGVDVAKRAMAFLRPLAFRELGGAKVFSAFSVLQEVMLDDDGKVEQHIRLRPNDGTIFGLETDDYVLFSQSTPPENAPIPPPAKELEPPTLGDVYTAPADEEEDDDDDDFDEYDEDFDDEDLEDGGQFNSLDASLPTFSEKTIRAGDVVCVIGRYDAAKHGLVPASHGAGRYNRLIPGAAEDVAKRLGNSMRGYFFGGLIAILFFHGAAYAITQLYLRSDDTQRKRFDAAKESVEKNDIPGLQKLAYRGFNIRTRDSEGRTLLMLAKDGEMAAYLISQGVDINTPSSEGRTPLMQAVAQDNLALVEQLITAGADLNVREPQYNASALILADGRENFDIADRLRKAGAQDDVVNDKNGTPLPSDGGQPLAACRAYLDAIDAIDVAALQKTISQQNRGGFSAENLREYRTVRPRPIESFTGFTSGDRATITLRGPAAGAGYGVVWVYQLARESGHWKILRERWAVKHFDAPAENPKS